MPSAARTPRSDPEQVERELDTFVAKFAPDTAALIRACRAALRTRLPTAIEIVYDNYNFFVIGYAPTERPSDCVVSLAAAANGVGLSFYRGATLPDPHGLLLGAGKQNRFVRLSDASVLAEPRVDALVQAALDQATVPMPATGGGYVIVKSISAKQRPRR